MAIGDLTSIDGMLDFLFQGIENNIFGSLGLTMLAIIGVFLTILFLMKPNRFVVIGWVSVLFIGLASFGYSYVGWLGGLAFVFVGIALGFIFLKILD